MNEHDQPQPTQSIAGNEAAIEIFYDLVADLDAYRQKLEAAGVSAPFIVQEVIRHAVGDVLTIETDPAMEMANKYPAYWKVIPPHWRVIDYYRIRELFPSGDPSTRLDHAFKKLMVPGVRTGGKSMRKDVSEAHATIGAWLMDNPSSE